MTRTLARAQTAALILLVASCLGGPAFAQIAGPVASSVWSDVLVPILLTTAGAVITGLVGVAVELLRRYVGVQLDDNAQRTLHSAAMTGVNLGLARVGQATGLTGSGKAAVVDAAFEYVATTGAPDAVARLKLDDAAVRNLVESKVGALVNASATVAVTTGSVPVGA